MKKCMVMYSSSTGNTEQMAQAIAEQARKEGAEVVLCPASALPAAELPTITHWALGCSAHGVEELDGDEFLPALAQIEPYLRGKPVLLFGSYGWGSGQWLEDWCARCKEDGAVMQEEPGVMANEAPDDDAIAACNALGAKLAAC